MAEETRDKKQDTNGEESDHGSASSADGLPITDHNDSDTTKKGNENAQREVNVDYKDKYLRALADYQNLQKETAQRLSEWAAMGELSIVNEFIPVYDNLKKAFGGEQGLGIRDQGSWVKGIEQIMKQLGAILKQHGVEEIKTVGEKFNAELHESVGEEESDAYDEGVIVREVESGYMMRGKVLKPAKAIVAMRFQAE